MKGYEILIRKDGSKVYLCESCASVGFASNDEETMIIHVVSNHTKNEY